MPITDHKKTALLIYAENTSSRYTALSGKNASYDILYTGNVDGFCLVTSDSDFTKLAIRLRDELKARIAKILSTVSQGSEWVRLADLGNALPKHIPGFSLKFYGCSKLKQLMMKFGDRFEMQEMGELLTDLYVRDKQ